MNNEQFRERINELWTQTKAGKLPRADRFAAIERLTDEYIAATGRRPNPAQLDRLATLCLYEEVSDPHPDKMTREEYPIMSDDQLARREEDEHLLAEIHSGRDRVMGFRKTWHEDDVGVIHERRQKIHDYSVKIMY